MSDKNTVFVASKGSPQYLYQFAGSFVDNDPHSKTYGEAIVSLVRVGDEYGCTHTKDWFDEMYDILDDAEALKIISKNSEAIRNGSPIVRVGRTGGHQYSSAEQAQEHQEVGFDGNQPRIGELVEPGEADDFKNLVLAHSVMEDIDTTFQKLALLGFLGDDWGLKRISNTTNQSIINFVGPSGVGKTHAARAIARRRGKKLLIADWSQIINCLVGETAKNISLLFSEATRLNADLFLDEADTMFCSRSAKAEDSVGKSMNAERNTVMMELSKFKGLIIAATNLFEGYDPAIVRRITQTVTFELPNEEMRLRILDLKIPSVVPRRGVDLEEIAKMTDGFSGDDLRKMAELALVKAASEYPDSEKSKRHLRQEHLLEQLNKARKVKDNFSGQVVEKRILGLSHKVSS